jgi:hypothetical protein
MNWLDPATCAWCGHVSDSPNMHFVCNRVLGLAKSQYNCAGATYSLPDVTESSNDEQGAYTEMMMIRQTVS